MPAQTAAPKTVYYEALDTSPNLEVCISDGTGPIALTGATVTIDIAYAKYSYYYSPTKKIVEDGACVVNPDQVNFTGWVSWTPQTDDLQPPGNFLYRFRIEYPSGQVGHFPKNTYMPMIITTPIGGFGSAVTGAP